MEDKYSPVNIKVGMKLRETISSLDKAIDFVRDLSEISGQPMTDIKNVKFNNKEGNPIMTDFQDLENCISKYLGQSEHEQAITDAKSCFQETRLPVNEAYEFLVKYL